MAGLESKNLSLIRTLEILENYSDCDHPLTQKDIINYLMDDYGIEVERKTIGRNLALLKDIGYEIESVKQGSYLAVRRFEDSELRLLIDGVLASKYITAKHSKELINKLCGLSNKYFRNKVKHIRNLPENMPQNKELFYTIEVLDEAIGKGRQVAFRYNDMGTDKKQYPRKNSEGNAREYIVNPYQMVATNGRYYLICNYDKYDNAANYRIDRITDIRLLDTPVKPMKKVDGLQNGLDLPKHMAEHIYMFADKTEKVTFRAKKYIVSEIIDWFGKDVKFSNETDDEVTAEVSVSKMAMKFTR